MHRQKFVLLNYFSRMKLRLRDWKFKNFYKSIWNFKEILFLFEKFPRISQRLPAFTNRLLFLFILIRKFCYMEIRCHKILIITPIYFSLQKAGPKPTAQLDRTNDNVYHSTTCVVRSVMALSRSVQQQQSTHYLENCCGIRDNAMMDLTTNVDKW